MMVHLYNIFAIIPGASTTSCVVHHLLLMVADAQALIHIYNHTPAAAVGKLCYAHRAALDA